MPKAPTSPTSATVKSEPYPSDSPSKSPTKAKGGQVRGVTFTEEMDKEIIHHILSISDINLRYNWPDLVKNKFPNLTTKQLKNRWDNKLKAGLFPPEVMKMSQQAKAGGKAAKTEE